MTLHAGKSAPLVQSEDSCAQLNEERNPSNDVKVAAQACISSPLDRLVAMYVAQGPILEQARASVSFVPSTHFPKAMDYPSVQHAPMVR